MTSAPSPGPLAPAKHPPLRQTPVLPYFGCLARACDAISTSKATAISNLQHNTCCCTRDLGSPTSTFIHITWTLAIDHRARTGAAAQWTSQTSCKFGHISRQTDGHGELQSGYAVCAEDWVCSRRRWRRRARSKSPMLRLRRWETAVTSSRASTNAPDHPSSTSKAHGVSAAERAMRILGGGTTVESQGIVQKGTIVAASMAFAVLCAFRD